MDTPENFTPPKEPEILAGEKAAEKAPEEKGASVFEFFEMKVAAACGLSRDRIAELRKEHLTEGVDWAYVCKRVLYTLAGAEKIRTVLELPPGVINDAQPDTAEQPEPVNLVVFRTFPKGNTQILEAHKPGADPGERENILRVRVRSSLHYVPGMNIPALAIDEAQGLYQCARPDPRWKGTW